MTMLKNKLVLTGALSLIIGVAIGYLITPSLSSRPASMAGMRGGAANFAGRTGAGAARIGAGGGFVSGIVASKDSESITVNTQDGSSHVILFTPDTAVSKSVGGSISDVSVGSNVTITGSTNSDGSISASLIQLRPATTTQAN